MRSILGKGLLAAVALAAAAACPAQAREAEVKVSTFSVYEAKLGGCEARIVTPYVSGLAIDALQNEINEGFMRRARETAIRYEQDVLELAMSPFGSDDAHMGLILDYRIIDGDERFIALDVIETNTVGSSSTTRSIINFERETGLPISLSYFFNEKVDPVRIVSAAVRDEMRRANKLRGGSFWYEAPKPDKKKKKAAGEETAVEEEETPYFKSIKPDQSFYVNKAGNIVICFDKYEVAPGSEGCPEVEIPMKNIAQYLKAK